MDLGLINLGIGKNTVDGGGGGSEKVLAELLESSTGDGGVEINAFEKRVDFDGGLCR